MKSSSYLKQWKLSLLGGIILIAIALLIVFAGISNYTSIVIPFVVGFAIIGGLRAYFGLKHRRELPYWRLLLLNGLIEIGVFAVPLLFASDIESMLPIYVGFILLFRTIIGIGVSFNFYYSHLKTWFVPFVFSILGLAASFFMIWSPVSSGMHILIYPVITLGCIGVAQIGIATGLKKLNTSVENNNYATA